MQKRLLLLALSLFAALGAMPQGLIQTDTIGVGIHYSGGVSYNSIASSNIGDSCVATGLNSFTGGYHSLASGSGSFAFGYTAMATQPASYALGVAAQANGSYSMSMGSFVRANQNSSIVIGSGYDSGNPLSSSTTGIKMGMGSALPTLYLTKASGYNQTGRVGIGDVTPQAKLHIRSDDGEDAGIFLQPANPASDTYIRLRDNAHRIAVDGKGCMSVVAGNANALEVVSSNMKLSGSLMTLGGTDNGPLYLYSGGTPSVTMNALPSSDGYSRNAIAPSYAIEFGANGLTLRTATYMIPRYDFITNWRDALLVKTNGAITLNGRVGVNTENTTGDYALAVDGGIITTKVHIQDVNDWEDRVFDADYPLMTLDEVEAYVAEHRHLPGIPSEAEVMADGFDLTAMAAALLGKVEELTLHTIHQQREIDSLRDLVTVRFGYDACGNRTRRTLEFSMVEEERSASPGGTPHDAGAQWQASLSDSFAGMEAMLFPNPTEGGFFLVLSGGEPPDGATATLCSVDGKAIEERKVGGVTEEFDLRGKPAGVYLLRLSSSDSVKTWRIVKR